MSVVHHGVYCGSWVAKLEVLIGQPSTAINRVCQHDWCSGVDFAGKLSAFMAERDIGVRALARRVPCDAALISRLARGGQQASVQMARRLDDVLDAGGELVRAAAAGRGASHRAGSSAEFGGGVTPAGQAMQARLGAFSAVQVQELISHLNEQWHALVKTDNLLGPRHALGGVNNNLGVIDALLRGVRQPVRDVVLGLGARYAESAAWLYEDSADTAAARYWTRRSMEWAMEGNDRLMVSWTLFRRGQQAAADRDAAQMAGMAAAARREAGALPSLMLAAILQQEAHAYALDGEERACQGALDRAHLLAAAADDPGDASAGHGSFCTPAYLEMQRGACWLTLGQPARAITALETALKSLPPAYRRDRGVALSCQAAALATGGEPAEAARTAREALDIARASGSGRVLSMIVPVAARLAPHGRIEAVAELRSALAETEAV
jgi:tetratricopeptide (TPR) repeat protein